MSQSSEDVHQHMHALTSQVGGHPGVMSSEDGSVIIKPCLHLERQFYETVNQDERYRSLRRAIPKFFGTLKLEGRMDPSGSGAVLDIDVVNQPAEAESKESIVLENVAASFERPNTMDVKLGTVLYDIDASDEKKARMEETARKTTSYETGVRLTGFQVFDYDKQAPEMTPKAYGKSIKASQLPEGMARFFPLATSADKPSGQGLPAHLLIPILEGIQNEVKKIKTQLEQLEFTMIGTSLLIVYEASWEQTANGLEYLSQHPDSDSEEEEEEEEEEDCEDFENDDSVEARSRTAKPGPPFKVRLIDFAHTRFVPGQGPDRRMLKGIDTVLTLLEGRIREVRELSSTTKNCAE